jgi:hypothetical protein
VGWRETTNVFPPQTFKINTEERCTVLQQHLATGIYLFRLIVEKHEEAFCRSPLLSGRRYLPYVSSVSIASCHSVSILKFPQQLSKTQTILRSGQGQLQVSTSPPALFSRATRGSSARAYSGQIRDKQTVSLSLATEGLSVKLLKYIACSFHLL